MHSAHYEVYSTRWRKVQGGLGFVSEHTNPARKRVRHVARVAAKSDAELRDK